VQKLIVTLLSVALVSCSTFDRVPDLDTPGKRAVAASAQIESLATVTLALYKAGTITTEQASRMAESLQGAQDLLTAYYDLSQTSEGKNILLRIGDILSVTEALLMEYLEGQDNAARETSG
jgi:hypothetical protein